MKRKVELNMDDIRVLDMVAFGTVSVPELQTEFIVMDLEIRGMGLIHIGMTMDQFSKFRISASNALKNPDNRI